jgi:hypothetical protein
VCIIFHFIFQPSADKLPPLNKVAAKEQTLKEPTAIEELA